MKQIELKYGCNPNQKPAKIFAKQGELPVQVLCGKPGYINFLDALNGFALVSELSKATGKVAAASFKHVSPSGVALGLPLSVEQAASCFVADIEDLSSSPIACAYARARGTDRMSSFGDFIALSDTCDQVCARIISREVSDGIIAPNYTQEALDILKKKKNGNYNVIQIDSNYIPDCVEQKTVFGIVFEQNRNDFCVDQNTFSNIVTDNKQLTKEAMLDMTVALYTLKYTQSNSVCFVSNGQAIGIGAGQQSRIHCTRLAAQKADLWHARMHQKVLTLPFAKGIGRADKNNIIDLYLSDEQDKLLEQWQQYFTKKPSAFTKQEQAEWLSSFGNITLGSDAFFPFSDNVDRAYQSRVKYIIQPGGSARDDLVIARCNKLDIVMVFNGLRLFHH